MHHPTSRRRFITLAGGGAVVAALPLAGCASAYPDEATLAWRAAGAETDLRRHMLAHALLAPNPHNRQPWIADLSQPGRIGLVCDGERLLPETDPFGRQILIGCGAFIELAVIAAAQRSLGVQVDLFPEGPPAAGALPAGTRVATLTMGADGSAKPDPLFAQIVRRHTRKTAYDTARALPQGLASTWEANQLEEEPEVFPKQPRPGSLNAWFRLPGMHHTQPHYSRLWSGEEWLSDPWLEGHAAIDAMLQVIPGPPPPAPAGAPSPSAPERSAAVRKQRFSGAGRPTVCLDLDGVLVDRTYARGGETLGDPIDGAVEFTRALAEQADIVIHTARLAGRPAGASDGAAQAEQRRIEERIRAWLDQHGFAYKEIALAVGKPIASAYVDDRGVSCRPLDDGPRAFEEALAAVRRLCGPSG